MHLPCIVEIQWKKTYLTDLFSFEQENYTNLNLLNLKQNQTKCEFYFVNFQWFLMYNLYFIYITVRKHRIMQVRGIGQK